MKKRISDLNQLITQDEDEAKNIEENMKTWLIRSAEQYMQCLRLDELVATIQEQLKEINYNDGGAIAWIIVKKSKRESTAYYCAGSLSKLHVVAFVPFVQQISSALFKIRKNYKILFHSC